MISTLRARAHARGGWRPRLTELLAALRTWPWRDTLATLRARFREDRLGLTASSLTFTTTIALVPFLAVTLAVFTAFPMFGRFRLALERWLIDALVPDSIARPVLAALTDFASKASRLGSLGLILLVASALMLMLTIDRTLNNIWRVRQARPLTQRVLVYWSAATLGPLLLGVSLSMTSYAVSASRGWVGALPGGVRLVLDAIELLLVAAGAAALFRYVPNTHVRWRHAWAGGWFVSLGLEAAKRVLALYLSSAPLYTTVYGAFATVPIFLIWLYSGWVILLLGAVVAAYMPSLQIRAVRQPETPGHRFRLALQLLRVLGDARAAGQGGLTLDEAARALRCDPLQAEPALEALLELDWIARLDEPGDPRYVLLCEPPSTPLEPLVRALLLEHDEPVAALWARTGLGRLTLEDALPQLRLAG